MAKFIIYVTGKPYLHGLKKREFSWRPEYGCYIYENRLIEESEFDAKIQEAFRRHEDMHPSVRIVEMTKPTTIKDAEDILRKHAPHRLRKTDALPAKELNLSNVPDNLTGPR